MSENIQPTMCYPSVDEYEYWKKQADEMDITVNEWILTMVQLGDTKLKKGHEPPNASENIHRRIRCLRTELRNTELTLDRIDKKLRSVERHEIISFIDNNPGAEADEIVEYIKKSTPSRVNTHLEMLTFEELTRKDGGFFVSESED